MMGRDMQLEIWKWTNQYTNTEKVWPIKWSEVIFSQIGQILLRVMKDVLNNYWQIGRLRRSKEMLECFQENKYFQWLFYNIYCIYLFYFEKKTTLVAHWV